MANEEGSHRSQFWNLNLGHVLTIAAMLGGGLSAYYGMKADLQSVDLRVSRMETALSQLTQITITTARQDEKLSAMEQRLNRLEARQH